MKPWSIIGQPLSNVRESRAAALFLLSMCRTVGESPRCSGEAQRQGADSPHERPICGRVVNAYSMRQPKKTMKNTRGKASARGQTAPMSDQSADVGQMYDGNINRSLALLS